MQNPFADPNMKQYFDSLSPFVQESIYQSGVKFDSLDHLQSFAQNLQKQ